MTDKNPEKQTDTNYKTKPDSLWQDYKKTRKFDSLENFGWLTSDILQPRHSINKTDSVPKYFEKDILFKILLYGFAIFFLTAMIIFGGRDLLLLGFGQNSSASLMPAKTYSCGKACYKITYQFVVNGNLYYATGRTTYNYNNPQTATISYFPWYPDINKIQDDIFYSKP